MTTLKYKPNTFNTKKECFDGGVEAMRKAAIEVISNRIDATEASQSEDDQDLWGDYENDLDLLRGLLTEIGGLK